MALAQHLTTIAITDHDSVDGVSEALSAAQGTDLEVIPGIEINTDYPGSEVHLLGYYVDYTSRILVATLRRLRESRRHRAERMIRKLAEIGLLVDLDRVREIAGKGTIGRPHIARALVECGYVRSIPEAFARYIGRNGPAYVERFKLTPEDAIRLILDAGGVPVLAHPLDCKVLIAPLAAVGLMGLEAYYTGYTEEQTSLLVAEAKALGLIVTGGSDFHGPDVTPGITLGGVKVPCTVVEMLKARRRSRLKGDAQIDARKGADKGLPKHLIERN